MIKGEFQIIEPALSHQPLTLQTKPEKSFSEEVIIKDAIVEEIKVTKFDSKIYYSRLKKRRRCRSSNIL